MMRERRCEEVVTGNGHKYKLAGTFGNIERLSLAACDPSELFVKLSNGRMPPGDIKTVIACTLEEIDGQPASEFDRDEIAVQFVEDFGLQDCSLLARQLISHAIIGDVKKKQIALEESIKGMKKSSPFRLMRFVRAGLLWAGLLMIFVLLANQISKLF
ncbi:MAG: hypothetical protein KAT62_03870 [Desulfuromonadales bacterium]|nr:hypothetical protein [Desulfuromonadales bacterium]